MSEVNRKAFEILKSACAQELAEALAQAKSEGASEVAKAIAAVFGVGLPTVERWVNGASLPHPAVSTEMTAACKAEGAAEERASVAGVLTQLARQYRYDQEAASDADVSELWGNCAGALELAAEEVRARGEKKP